MSGRKDSHELAPNQIKTLKVAQNHLCSLANYRGTLRPEMCEKCDAFCKYGARMLELIGRPIPVQVSNPESVAKMAKQGQMLPSLRQRLKYRKR